MQPLLLLKQTLDASYQSIGALLLNGSHVKAVSAGELLSKVNNKSLKQLVLQTSGWFISDKSTYFNNIELVYENENANFHVVKQRAFSPKDHGAEFVLTPSMEWSEVYSQLPEGGKIRFDINTTVGKVRLDRGLLQVPVVDQEGNQLSIISSTFGLANSLVRLLHIPGLRVPPERNYLTSFFDDYQIIGTFDLYAAGIISQWQQEKNIENIVQLNDSLQRLGLTNAVTAKVKNANEVELSVNRLPAASKAKPRKADMVNIADVGIGVSQVLPILVALIAAQEGQLVYVEQPELHLHPRAQVAMGELLAEAANRGVRVIVETHSSLLLLTVQTLIAQGKIKNTDVGLHWFTRNAKGATDVQYVQPDEDGAYGAWPEDFSEIELKAQDAYLTAVGLRQFGEAAQ
jgi:hypothetical protein